MIDPVITFETNAQGEPVKVTTWPNGAVVRELAVSTLSAAEPRTLDGVAFLRRFTQPQRVAIRGLAKTDPNVEDFMALLDATIAQAGRIDLDDPDTVAGVQYVAGALPAQNINPQEILA